ncbi:type VI secretion system tube protein Hcp [Parasulfuritortus cantonensis]|uniref:Type VI secretion system tube protein Hcp n=1 Tax=Parasulfuritortus cantonensis TaxID=2528202 RepID=A0A4R1BSN6_9PROT|nr:type VI secretion system tube protein Hcp [Parasulfuritortus cantonensis]TCJ20397.1 type VI secretion system tube protein Hcp [Parasulfuritortus cantonensis]
MADVDYFLKIAGIDGESTDSKHANEIELMSWSWGESNSATIGSATGGAGAGRVQMQDFTVSKVVDKSSVNLMKTCAIGDHIDSIILVGRKAGKEQQEYFKITFTECMVTSYSVSASGDTPMESVSFAFSKIEMIYKPQKKDGSLGGDIKASYDLITNKGA